MSTLEFTLALALKQEQMKSVDSAYDCQGIISITLFQFVLSMAGAQAAREADELLGACAGAQWVGIFGEHHAWWFQALITLCPWQQRNSESTELH